MYFQEKYLIIVDVFIFYVSDVINCLKFETFNINPIAPLKIVERPNHENKKELVVMWHRTNRTPNTKPKFNVNLHLNKSRHHNHLQLQL